jgi:polygalacturonase
MKTAAVLLLAAVNAVSASVYNFADLGGIPNDNSSKTEWYNGGIVNATLLRLQAGDTLLFPSDTYHLMGGITGAGLADVTFQFDGEVVFSNNTHEWPRNENGDVLECFHFTNFTNAVFTSSGLGTLNGNGHRWWGLPGLGYLHYTENRPRLFNVENSKNILVENLLFLDSPYWTFWVHGVDGLEVRHSEISARRTTFENHSLVDMSAFNTDGFDVSGKNVWIHDCTVWCQDDTIAVKVCYSCTLHYPVSLLCF